MTNNGASKGCHACRQKRKKCDQTKPSCMRCTRMRRHCPGYMLRKDLKFINYIGEADPSLMRQRPENFPVEAANYLGVHDWPKTEEDARSQFFNDYCIVSSNQDMSRGYFHSLPTMIAEAGPTSELAQACTIIGLTLLGRKQWNPIYNQRAEQLYSSMLRSFRILISDEAKFVAIESLLTASLLGLYEILISTANYPAAHVAHARGVSAILVGRYSPFDLICGGRLFQVTPPILLEYLNMEDADGQRTQCSPALPNKRKHRISAFCTSVLRQYSSSIDFVYSQTEPLIQKAHQLLATKATLDEIRRLKSEVEELYSAYKAWPETLPRDWAPKLVGVIAPRREQPAVGYWPGPVFSYYDPYIASVWNSYRKASLHVLAIISSCERRISNLSTTDDQIERLREEEAAALIGDIFSSIPYILAADLHVFLENSTSTLPLIPGRPAGALLSMYALWVLETISSTDSKVKTYARECLEWIGSRMGIGQATVLSKCTSSDEFPCYKEARVIIWTGMLI